MESVYYFTKLFILLIHLFIFLVIRSIEEMKHSVSQVFVKINTIWYAFFTFFVNICHAEYVFSVKKVHLLSLSYDIILLKYYCNISAITARAK